MVALMKPDNQIVDTIIHGDALEVLRALDTCSVDACVVDPPYGLGEVKDIAGLLQAWIRDEDDSCYLGKSGFMGKEWDAGVPGPRYWREVLRVMKPGSHILCFASTRTVDLMMIALRLAGFQCRDTLMWVYGQGFPKNTDISKKIDKMQGAEREVIGPSQRHSGKSTAFPKRPGERTCEESGRKTPQSPERAVITAPATPEACQHAGTGTALKPAHEPIILARKPLSEKSIAENVLRWGTGGLAIDQCRVGTSDTLNIGTGYMGYHGADGSNPGQQHPQGRFPSNLLLSHSWLCTDELCDEQCPIRLLDKQSGVLHARGNKKPSVRGGGMYGHKPFIGDAGPGDQGGASRYFTQFCYTAKASRAERNRGCEELTDYLLDSTEIVVIELSQYCQAGGSQWENPALRVQLQVDTAQSPPRVIDVSGTSHNNVSEWNTFLFGNDTTAPFLKGCKFTTVTKTNSITQSKTLNWLTPLLTSVSIAGVNLEMVNGGSHVANVETFSESQLVFTNEETVYLPGARSVASKTLWRISASVKNKGVYNNGSGFSGRTQINGTWVNTDNPRTPSSNSHPCVKPLQLMSWLCRLITPPGGIVLDCFAGSGSTCVAAIHERLHFIAIEQDASYCEIARARVAQAFGEVAP